MVGENGCRFEDRLCDVDGDTKKASMLEGVNPEEVDLQEVDLQT